MSVQFSGGEPTLSPHFLRAIQLRAATSGYFCVQCATNGIRFAQDPEFARQAKEAGLRLAYLQFDGVTNEANSHRKVGNLFDVKLRAIENLHAAGIDVVLVVTVVNGVNDDQVGPIVDFAIENADKITVVCFQPVSFTGRDEDISDERARARSATRSPPRARREDADRRDRAAARLVPALGDGPVQRPHRHCSSASATDWGALKCGCHPNCGIGTVLFVNKRTKQMVPLAQFLDLEQLLARHPGHHRRRAARAPSRSRELAVALASRTSTPTQAPPGFGFATLVTQFLSQTGRRAAARSASTRGRERVRVARALRRRDVVPGPLQLRLPPHRDVHHPLRHADGGDQLLRVQHGRRLAARHREDEGERDASPSGTGRTGGTRSTPRTRGCRWRPRSARFDCRSCRSRGASAGPVSSG